MIPWLARAERRWITLGLMLSHRIRAVSEILAPHVEHLWVVRGYLAARWRNMILPDGAMELIVNLGDPQKLCAQDSPAKHTIFRHSWISGERTTPIVIDEIGYVHLVGVRQRAGGAWPFLGIPLREFTDQVVELETIMGREIEDLRDALCEAWDDDSRFDLLKSWLVRRARSRTQPTRSVSYALRVIQGGLDAMRIGRIADTIGISHKHLLREFDRCGFESCFISERQVRDSRDYFREIHHPSEIRPYEISWALLPRQRRVRLLERRHQQH